MGTPDFAVPAFSAIIESGRYDVLAAVTQPDKPAGRGLELKACPVKLLAQSKGIPVFQPNALKNIEAADGKLITTSEANTSFVSFLNEHAPIDAFIVIAYGKILVKSLLEFSRAGAINAHASLLPRWRGAAPIHRALFAGDNETGVCLMKLEEGLDTGPVYSTEKIHIREEDTFGLLHDSLASIGAKLLERDLPKILDGSLTPKPQPTTGVTHADKWSGEDAVIHWNESAEITLRRIRTCSPQPGARCSYASALVKIFKAKAARHEQPAAPGSIVELQNDTIIVATGGNQYIAVEELQFAGKKRLPAAEVIKGRTLKEGEQFH